MAFTYYLDGQSVGSHVPDDAEALRKAKFTIQVGVWCTNAAASITGYVDDVRVGQF
jgi:hypothetical protein